jgi:hypothetical protein
MDADDDGDVDLVDFASFETCGSGDQIPANPACDDQP